MNCLVGGFFYFSLFMSNLLLHLLVRNKATPRTSTALGVFLVPPTGIEPNSLIINSLSFDNKTLATVGFSDFFFFLRYHLIT